MSQGIGMISLPFTQRGRRSKKAEARYQAELTAFCAAIREIRSTLDFEVSSRGWCYILEEHGLTKGEFDRAQTLITDCRKSGFLPLNIVAEDVAREFEHLEDLDSAPETEAESWVYTILSAHERYQPVSFWADLPCYVEMLVEKVDLRSLFSPICQQYQVPIANGRGWSDLNTRATMMRRFAEHEAQGQQCVLCYCGDHDPAGLQIGEFLRSNMTDLANAVGWRPDNLIIDRFGLNYDFITQHRLSWVDNLETGSGRHLNDPRHPDHKKPYVQDYLRRFGVRKVEANALVVRPQAGRELCRQAILRYVSEDAPMRYQERLEPWRHQLREEILQRLNENNG